MILNPKSIAQRFLGNAIEWRFRDRLQAERETTVALGQTFMEQAVKVTDRQELLEQRVAELERRIDDLEKGR